MKLSNPTKVFILLTGDIIILYLTLFLTLLFRYGADLGAALPLHLGPFTIVFGLWLIVFYAAGLYDLRRLKNNIEFLKTLGLTLTLNALLTIVLFYLVPAFGITPKTTLFIFVAVFAIIEIVWRRFFNRLVSAREELLRLLFFGDEPRTEELVQSLRQNPQLGYEVTLWLKQPPTGAESDKLKTAVKRHEIDFLIVPRETKDNLTLTKIFYELLSSGLTVYDLISFYERALRRLPVRDLSESWWLEHVTAHKEFYDDLKRTLEFAIAFGLFIILLPLILLIALFIKLTSPGPVILSQRRVGQFEKPFTLYKFRTMRENAEANGAQWAAPTDPRITLLGRLLRYSHLDELPQLWNVIRGDLSFVGPRPERPEFVSILKEKIPHYELRHLLKPGISGWAQINFRYGASVHDAEEKLEYDLYYLKNRSLILDLAILIKTLKSFFVTPK